MQELKKIRAKTKLLKYIFLSASLCVLIAVLTTLYVQKLPIEDKSDFKKSQKKSRKLPEEYSLNISKSIFKGISSDLAPYVIMAQNVVKNSSDKYLLDIVNGTYTLPDGKITIKADNGTLDEIKKSVILNDNVSIHFNGMIINSQQILVDLETKDAKSQEEVEVIFENSKIRADKFQTEDSAETIKFEGNIDSSFDINSK